MVAKDAFFVRFWGVRGGISSPGAATVRYGGNTACLEVRCGPHILIFDGGTGVRPLGHRLDEEAPVKADLFFTHTHFERICGLPFFSAGFNPKNRFRFWAGHLPSSRGIRHVVTRIMTDPLFPVPIEAMRASLEFRDFKAGAPLHPRPGVVVKTAALNRRGRLTGYRIEYRGKAVCYASDVVLDRGTTERRLLELLRRADIVIFNPAPGHGGDGGEVGADSRWRVGLELCQRAGAERYVIFHHRPGDSDEAIDAIAAKAAALRPGTVAAREGMTLTA